MIQPPASAPQPTLTDPPSSPVPPIWPDLPADRQQQTLQLLAQLLLQALPQEARAQEAGHEQPE